MPIIARRCRLILFLAALLLTVDQFTLRLEAAPVPKADNELERVLVLKDILSKHQNEYILYAAEPFENIRLWKSYASSTPLDDLRYLNKTPDSRAFSIESALKTLPPQEKSAKSLFLQISFESPGKQVYQIQPKDPILIKGRLSALSLWVHSNRYRHSMTLLFRNASEKIIRIEAGNLNWFGWKRLYIPVNTRNFGPNKNQAGKFEHQLIGILIRSHKKEDPGSVSLMLDNLLILSDIREMRYPGSEHQDSW